MKKIFKYVSVLLLVSVLAGCQGTKQEPEKKNETAQTKQEKTTPSQNPTATIEMSNGKKIELELYYEKAPNTVANFITLADSGFYNNLTFHRVIKDFMIQGGDPKGTGTGGPDYKIKGEFPENKFPQNDIKHERGVISMARSSSPNSAGSQFFIMHKTTDSLDGKYAAFGKVTSGMEVVDEIAQADTDGHDKPKIPQVIKSITVDKKGGTFVVEKITT